MRLLISKLVLEIFGGSVGLALGVGHLFGQSLQIDFLKFFITFLGFSAPAPPRLLLLDCLFLDHASLLLVPALLEPVLQFALALLICLAASSDSLGSAILPLPVLLPLLLLLLFLFVFVERLINFVELLCVDGIEDLVCQVLAIVDDSIPLLPALSILHERYVVIVDFLGR